MIEHLVINICELFHVLFLYLRLLKIFIRINSILSPMQYIFYFNNKIAFLLIVSWRYSHFSWEYSRNYLITPRSITSKLFSSRPVH